MNYHCFYLVCAHFIWFYVIWMLLFYHYRCLLGTEDFKCTKWFLKVAFMFGSCSYFTMHYVVCVQYNFRGLRAFNVWFLCLHVPVGHLRFYLILDWFYVWNILYFIMYYIVCLGVWRIMNIDESLSQN